MKKSIVILLFSMFLIGLVGTTYHEAKGNKQEATKYECILFASLAIPAIHSQRMSKTHLGLLSKSYFTDSPADRPLTTAQKKLWDYLTGRKAKLQTQQTLSDGDLKMETYAESLMFTMPISVGGRRDLLNQTNGYFEGRIPEEWNLGALPQGFNIAVSHIGVGYATDAAITVPEGDTDFVTQPNSWPAALRNSRIIISQNSTIVQQFRTKFAGSMAASTNNCVEGDGLEFQEPFILEEQKPIRIEIFCPQAVNFPATPAGLFIEIKMFGACVRPQK
jgi:hypothetical protein